MIDGKWKFVMEGEVLDDACAYEVRDGLLIEDGEQIAAIREDGATLTIDFDDGVNELDQAYSSTITLERMTPDRYVGRMTTTVHGGQLKCENGVFVRVD